MADHAFIALLGETGSGKTTFVNRATNSDAFLVGNGLRSCTSEVQLSPQFLVDGNPVVLIDTPGFNDTIMEDADVLKDIAGFLATVYENEVKLAGVIYFHRISDERWRRSDTRSFGWLKRICGEQSLKNVVLMTNMWDNVKPEVGAARERQLAEEFVKPALDEGAQLLRHQGTTESAHDIIRAILGHRRAVLQVQQELVDEEREFDRTTVGGELSREVGEFTRRLGEQVEELRAALKKVGGGGNETRLGLEAEVTRLRGEIKDLTDVSRDMNKDYNNKKEKANKQWTSLGYAATSVGAASVLVAALLFGWRLYRSTKHPTSDANA